MTPKSFMQRFSPFHKAHILRLKPYLMHLDFLWPLRQGHWYRLPVGTRSHSFDCIGVRMNGRTEIMHQCWEKSVAFMQRFSPFHKVHLLRLRPYLMHLVFLWPLRRGHWYRLPIGTTRHSFDCISVRMNSRTEIIHQFWEKSVAFMERFSLFTNYIF